MRTSNIDFVPYLGNVNCVCVCVCVCMKEREERERVFEETIFCFLCYSCSYHSLRLYDACKMSVHHNSLRSAQCTVLEFKVFKICIVCLQNGS